MKPLELWEQLAAVPLHHDVVVCVGDDECEPDALELIAPGQWALRVEPPELPMDHAVLPMDADDDMIDAATPGAPVHIKKLVREAWALMAANYRAREE